MIKQIRAYFIYGVIWWLEERIKEAETERHRSRMFGFTMNESFHNGRKQAYIHARDKMKAVVEGRDVLPKSNPVAGGECCV